MIVFAFPSGYLADRYRRDRMLRLSACVGFIAIILSLFTFSSLHDSLLLLYVCLILWALFDASNNAALESIFADSVPPGERSRIFSYKHSVSETRENE